MKYDNFTIEVSLKPFLRKHAAPLNVVCEKIFEQWKNTAVYSEQVSIMLWTGDGSEILDFSGDLHKKIDWSRYVGVMNRKDALGGENYSEDNRDAWAGHYFEEGTKETDYQFLKVLVTELKKTGTRVFGKEPNVGTTFDPGPEFAVSTFKYKHHKEILLGSFDGSLKEIVSCCAKLHADNTCYAAYPKGIPEGTPFGRFLGKQSSAFLKAMNMDFIWFSNGFGFGNVPWQYNGVSFDGKTFNPNLAEAVRSEMLGFWNEFRTACKYPVLARGTNLTTGRDLSCDAVPLKDIYDGKFIQAPPVNSPWFCLNYDFGSELAGWMSHVAGFPSDDFTFRFYLHDPWFQTKPWLLNYAREPYDIYMPFAVSRLRKNGRIVTHNRVNIITGDDCHGELPEEAVEQVTPHLNLAKNESPDAPGPLVWLYPFDEYHRWIRPEYGRIGEVFAGDHFIRNALNAGLPLNTVMSTADCDVLPEKRVIISPVPEEGTDWEKRILAFVESGGHVILYGPLTHAPKLRKQLGISLANELEGEFVLRGKHIPQNFAENRIDHNPVFSGGGLAETGGRNILISAESVMECRTFAAKQETLNGGKLLWLRTSAGICDSFQLMNEYFGTMPHEQYFDPANLLRSILAECGWRFEYYRKNIDAWLPMQTIHSHANALYFSGRNMTMTTEHILRTPLGAPVMTNSDFELIDNAAHYRFSASWHHECRVFVEGDDSQIKCSQYSSRYTDRNNCLRVFGLKNAIVRISLPEGLAHEPEILNKPYLQIGLQNLRGIPFEKCNTNGFVYYKTIDNYTGDLCIIW